LTSLLVEGVEVSGGDQLGGDVAELAVAGLADPDEDRKGVLPVVRLGRSSSTQGSSSPAVMREPAAISDLG